MKTLVLLTATKQAFKASVEAGDLLTQYPEFFQKVRGGYQGNNHRVIFPTDVQAVLGLRDWELVLGDRWWEHPDHEAILERYKREQFIQGLKKI